MMRQISDASLFKMWRRSPGWVPIEQLRRLRAYMILFEPAQLPALERDILTRLPNDDREATELAALIPPENRALRLGIDAAGRVN
jgi:hypothetical protein